ncbi:MAG: HD-GYP domain-containing protein [Aeoliella sp.]
MSNSSGNGDVAEIATNAVCVNCRLPLPIRPKRQGEVGKNWACIGCKTNYHAVLLENAPAEFANNVRAVVVAKPIVRTRGDSLVQDRLGAPQGVATKPLRPRQVASCTLQTQASRQIDSAVIRGQDLSVSLTGLPFSGAINKPGAFPYDPETESKQVESFQASIQQVESLVGTLKEGKSIDGNAHETIARETLKQATSDLDLFVRLGINPIGGGYPEQHSLHTSMLASAMGANLGWDHQTLVDLGVGCLIHDLGMLNVPDRVHNQHRVLSDHEYDRISAHPLHSFDLIEAHLSTLPLSSKMVAYQMHERCDGSGYPRKRRCNEMHDAAKVAAVADVYIALVSPRPHRPGLMPYYAVEHLLYGVKSNLFDSRSVRSLLKTISLFPIGSYVKLSDGRIARVLRANPADYYRPVVEAWRAEELAAAPMLVDLAKESRLSIHAPVASLPKA